MTPLDDEKANASIEIFPNDEEQKSDMAVKTSAAPSGSVYGIIAEAAGPAAAQGDGSIVPYDAVARPAAARSVRAQNIYDETDAAAAQSFPADKIYDEADEVWRNPARIGERYRSQAGIEKTTTIDCARARVAKNTGKGEQVDCLPQQAPNLDGRLVEFQRLAMTFPPDYGSVTRLVSHMDAVIADEALAWSTTFGRCHVVEILLPKTTAHGRRSSLERPPRWEEATAHTKRLIREFCKVCPAVVTFTNDTPKYEYLEKTDPRW